MATPQQPINPLNIINLRNDIVTLITPTNIKTYCGVAANIQDSNFIPSIIIATDLKIKPNLGVTLFNKLMVEFIAVNANPANLPISGSTDGVNYFELYEQIFKPLIWWAYTDSIAPIAIKVEEKGVQFPNSDYSENAGIAAMREIENRTRKNAEYYTEQLLCYIKNTFKDDADVVDEAQDEGSFFSGIFFPKDFTKSCSSCRTLNKLF